MTPDSTAPPVGAPAEPASSGEPKPKSHEGPPPELREEDASELTQPGTAPTRSFDPYRTTTGKPPEIDPSGLDPEAQKVVFRLRQFGYEAYLVGGCVRDLLLGRKPKDFDVATSALPNQVREVFRNCRLIGRRFRLAHVYFRGGKIVEVSTFRANPTELEETASEQPDETVPQASELDPDAEVPSAAREDGDDLLITHDNVFGTAEQDARRRDFTMNGLFYDIAGGAVIDYVHGLRDLRLRQIRTIGDPEVRMREDPVRILRAVRFASKLELDIEPRTYAAMEGAVEDLPRCAPPRLLEETFRLIRGGAAAGSLRLLAALDALKLLVPPIDEFLKAHGPEGQAQFFAFARALDARVAGGEPIEDATLLAALLVPISRALPAGEDTEAGRPSIATAIDELLQDFVRTARLPRRIAERCRMVLLAQRTLTGERRRRGALAGFRRNPVFNEALTVFEITVEATGQHTEALGVWKSGGTPEFGAAPAEGGRRKRRRRRRRGPGGLGSASSEGPSGGSDA